MMSIFAGVICSSPASAQPEPNPMFRHLTVEDGLPSGSVNCILQDRQGYIWIGTEGGLCRYDGVRFEYFFHNEQDSLSLLSNFVYALAEDSSGSIWVGTTAGLCELDPFHGTFKRLFGEGEVGSQNGPRWVSSLLCDTKGSVWASSISGLRRIDAQTGRVSIFRHDPDRTSSISSDSVFTLIAEAEGMLWLGTASGLDEFDPTTGRVLRHYSSFESEGRDVPLRMILSLLLDENRSLWVGTADGLIRFDLTQRRFQRLMIKLENPTSDTRTYVAALSEDSSKNVWVGLPVGLVRLDASLKSMSRYLNDPVVPTSLNNNQILSLVCDEGGTLWVGTRLGVNTLSQNANKFHVFRNHPMKANSLKNNRVWSFCLDDDNKLWLGTTGGVEVFHRAAAMFDHSSQGSSPHWDIARDFVWPIIRDRSGNHWLGTWTSGLVKVSSGGQIKKFLSPVHDFDARRVVSLVQDHEGIVWVGTGKGLYAFDPTSESFLITPAGVDLNFVKDDVISYLYEDSVGDLWIGTYNGVVHFDRRKGKVLRLGNSMVLCILERRSSSGEFIIGTTSGIDFVEPDAPERIAKHEGTESGLPSEVVCGMLEDSAGFLWLSTLRGLVKFNPDTKFLRVYDVHDGLPGNEFNQLAFLKSPSGEMFFGGNNGFVSFFPSELQDNPHVPPVVINRFRVFERGGKEDLLFSTSSKQLDLSSAQNTFSFEFAALDYAMPERNRYAIMLEGFEHEWRHLEPDQRSEMYTNLDPGEYTLRVRGSNGDGVWNNEGASVKILIHPPFWATWYFRGGAILCVVLLAVSFYTYRVKKVAERNIELESKVQERTRELHESNEQLSLYKNNLETQVKERTLDLERIVMTLQAEVSSRERIQKELINYQKDLQHLASDLSKSEERERRRIAIFLHDVVGQTLFFCKMKVGSMKDGPHAAELVKVHGLVEDLLNQVQSLTFDLSPPVLYELGLEEAIVWLIEQMRNTHSTEVHYTRTHLPRTIPEEARFVVFTAARELLTNALKHSAASRIDIALLVDEPGLIRLSVADDGCGLDAEQLLGSTARRKRGRGGFGLFNVRERMTFLGGTLKVESSPGRGTLVELTLPLNGYS